MQKGAIHDALKPSLSWLIGRWKSVRAEGSYPTIKSFNYCEELNFESVGQPFLNYSSHSWNPENGSPIHLESGFLGINPGTNQVAFMISHNLGVTSIEEGSALNNNELKLKSTQITKMSFARNPEVLGLERSYKLLEDGNLQVLLSMETANTPLTHHLTAVYKKI